MEAEQILERRDPQTSYRIPPDVEAIAVFDVALGPQVEAKPSPTHEVLSTLTRLHLLIEPKHPTSTMPRALVRKLDSRNGAADGVLANIQQSLELIHDVAGEDMKRNFEPIEWLAPSSTIGWQATAAAQMFSTLRSVMPSLDTQDRQTIEPRLSSLEALGISPDVSAPTPRAPETSPRTLQDRRRTSNTFFQEELEEEASALTSVLRLTSFPTIAELEDVVGPVWSLIAAVEDDPQFSLEIRYQVMPISQLGSQTVLTDLSIEMFIIARYRLLSKSDHQKAEEILRDVTMLLQTGFGSAYRFSPVSEALARIYRESQDMSYRIKAGHQVTLQEENLRIVPYRGLPMIGNVLRFLFSRGQQSSLSLLLYSLPQDDLSKFVWESRPMSAAVPLAQQANDTLSSTIRAMDVLHLFRPETDESPEEAICRMALTLELPERPSALVPEVVFRELLGDAFDARSAQRAKGKWTNAGHLGAKSREPLCDAVSLRESLTLLRFPTGSLPTFGDRTSSAAFQVPFEVAENNQGCQIGHAFHPDLPASIPVYLSDEDRRKHVYVVGKTGSGKTQFLLNMIMQDIEAGNGVCVIDPHGDLFEDVLDRYPVRRLHDLVIFDPTDHAHPPGLNLFEHDRNDPMHRDFVLDEAVSIFLRLHGNEMFGPRIQNYFRNGALALMGDPFRERTLLDIGRLFLDDDFFDYVMDASPDPAVADFLEEFKKTAQREKSEMIPYFQAKFAPFVSNAGIRNVIGQSRSTINFRSAMDRKRVVLVNLSKGKLGELNSKLLGMVMISKVTWAALTRAQVSPDQRSDFYLYCDEFQNFATDTFSTVLSEARKYGLCLTLAHQYLSQLYISDNFTNVNRSSLRDSVLGNAGNAVIFRVGATDAASLVEEIAGEASSKESIAGVLCTQPRFQAVVRLDCGGRPTHAFTLQTGLTKVRPDKARGSMIREFFSKDALLPREFVLADVLSSRTDYKADTKYDVKLEEPQSPAEAVEGVEGDATA
jgi:hypothetical protein